MNPISARTTRFVAWVVILGALFALLNVACVVMAAGDDTNSVAYGASMLNLPAESRELYRWGMLSNIFGFYLPFLVFGGYVWRADREKAGVLGDVAALAISLYVVLGVAGSAMQIAALQPLAHLHAGGDEATRAATEAMWTGLAQAVQKGLWWAEGPFLLFWTLVVGRQLKAAAPWRARILQAIGVLYGLFFLTGFFPELSDLTDLTEIVAVLVAPAWMLWSGWRMLREPAPAGLAA